MTAARIPFESSERVNRAGEIPPCASSDGDVREGEAQDFREVGGRDLKRAQTVMSAKVKRRTFARSAGAISIW